MSNMSLQQASEHDTTLFHLDAVADFETLLASAGAGSCPTCKEQLLWTRKKFNSGVQVLYETCPMCLPTSIQSMSPQEAAQRIETLQGNLENLRIISRDIQRIQTELQFMMIDIEESGTTRDLDTVSYEVLVRKAAKALEDNVNVLLDSYSGYTEPPIVTEQIEALCTDMNMLLEQVKRYKGENILESPSLFSLLDVLKQFEEVQYLLQQDESSWDESDLQHFREQVETLQIDLEHVQHAMKTSPVLLPLSGNVGILNGRFSSLLQSVGNHSKSDETALLRKQMEEMALQHSAQVAALQSQLDALMSTTVAANVVAVRSIEPQDSVDGSEAQCARQLPSTIVEAEVVSGNHTPRMQSIMTVQAEAVTSTVASNTCQRPSPASRHTQNGGRAVPRTTPHPRAQPATTAATNTESESTALGKLAQTDDVRYIIDKMKQFPKSILLQVLACEKLGALTCNNSDNVALVVARDGIGLILNMIQRFPSATQIQIHSLVVLVNLSRKSPGNKSKIGNAGIDLVLATMRFSPTDEKVQTHSLLLLGHLANKDAENTTSIGNKGGVSLILKGMGQFLYMYI